jgi:hypothetical protein
LNLSNLRPAVLGADRLAYVSYRKRNRVFWTSRKIRLFKGEAVLAGGANLVRGRCGNLISDVPSLPTSTDDEPSEKALNTPSLVSSIPSYSQMPGAITPLSAPSPEDSGTPAALHPAVMPDLVIASNSEPQGGDAYTAVPRAMPPAVLGAYAVRPSSSSGGSTTGGGTVTPSNPPPVDPPVTPPVDPPVTPPVDPPVTPPVDPPVTPPVDPPVNPPVNPPVTPPVDPPVTPPVDPPVTPPVDPPVTPPVDPPVNPPEPPSVPEPSTWLLAGGGVLALVWRARSVRHK